METVADFLFLGSKITADGDCSHEIKRCLLFRRKAMMNLDSVLKSRDITLPTKVRSQSSNFSGSHIWMWELNYKESWASKNWWFWTVMLEKTLDSLLNRKEIQPVTPKGNQSWIFIGRTDAEASWNCNPLAIWCEDLTPWKRLWCWERLKTGGEGDDRRWEGWMAPRAQWAWVWKLWELVTDREVWRAAVHGVTKRTWLSDWPTTTARKWKTVRRF